MDPNDPKYRYTKRGCNAARVGQAVADILSQNNTSQTAEETLEALGPDFVKGLEECISEGEKRLRSPFYAFVLTKKEPWTDNVVRNWFIARQSPPFATDMIQAHPHATKTLYLVDADKGDIKIIFSIPGQEECNTVIRNHELYHDDLIKWVVGGYGGMYNREEYSF